MSSVDVLSPLVDLVLPRECGGCGRPGHRCCPGCRAVLAAASPRRWQPDPPPVGFPPAWACLPYDGPVRRLVVTWKDGGRRDLAPLLAAVLARGLAAALIDFLDSRAGPTHRGRPPLLVVPAPSSRAATRTRGDRPLTALCRMGLSALPPGVASLLPALRHGRAVADQAGLGHRARAENLAGALVVTPRAVRRLDGAHCVLVDDVVTTGATLGEAARALRSAGAASVVAATVAATRRRSAR